jgi:bla regulator protein BlaR1
MIPYFLKSATCLALLLVFYHFILEKEKMHTFNRFYLLIGVIVSLIIPFATLTVEVPAISTSGITTFEPTFTTEETLPILVEEKIDYIKYIFGVYAIISILLFFRFGRNLFKIIQKIRLHTQIKLEKASLVLVDDPILPHTFWNFIFINKTDYKNGKIEEELFTHELTHVTQKHTIDVLLIEFLQAIFWINPLFIFLKKAMQLNHEFLADENVINQHKNTFHYQHILVNKAAWNNEYYLASNLNYSLTKKRLKMMTTQSSQTKIWLKKLAVIPLLAGFVFLFAERVEAQENEEITEIVEDVSFKKGDLSETEIYQEYFHSKGLFMFKDKNSKQISKKYNELTIEEKKRIIPPPPLKSKKKIPTQELIEKLKDGKEYAVWIDGKVVKNDVLNNYQASDFSSHFVSFIYKNARSKRFPQEHQAHLETTKYFNDLNKKKAKAFTDYLKDKYQIEEIIEEVPEKGMRKFQSKRGYIDTIPKKTAATELQMKEYQSIVTKRKKTDIFKVKEINKIKEIYTLMSDEQKKSVINVNDFIKTIPILTPKPNWVFTYKRLANRVERTSENRKANLIYFKEIYNTKMSDQERAKVTAPDKISPPPPSPTEEQNNQETQLNKYLKLSENYIGNENRTEKELEEIKKIYALLDVSIKSNFMSPDYISKNLKVLEAKHKIMMKAKQKEKVYKLSEPN